MILRENKSKQILVNGIQLLFFLFNLKSDQLSIDMQLIDQSRSDLDLIEFQENKQTIETIEKKEKKRRV
jgi:hypothetical protein